MGMKSVNTAKGLAWRNGWHVLFGHGDGRREAWGVIEEEVAIGGCWRHVLIKGFITSHMICQDDGQSST
jgi:hypothetical protein